ncbi:hypothetical protein PVAG01_03081 [Phlyctema vagabunda]|uniref:UDENN FLCN/SMCR8-type domain-containing protein n=1 Tax=Phlyctema vagabunda TaxID=108571 RepID=A0ABR4PST2_9HELO
MAALLCLAHFCETHGPTPLMVTEGQPLCCDTCFDDDEEPYTSRRPSTSSAAALPSQELAEDARARSTSSDQEHTTRRNARLPVTPPAIETPPESPRIVALQTGQKAGSGRRDSSFRKTYDENDQKRAIPCENCALTLPKKNKSPTSDRSEKTGSSQPILRTRVPYERVSSPIPRSSEPSPPKSNSSDSSDYDDAITSKHTRRNSRVIRRSGTSSSNSSFASNISHDHNMEYISTHEPLSPNSFSIVRQSCLRTLSCETLPPSSSSPTVTSPTSPLLNNPFSSGPSTPSTSSGGPILFGDPLAGYTTAYIFRIPDPTSRGRRRVYALMALSTDREQLAVKAFTLLSNAFKNLAQWITDLAARELERTSLSPQASAQSSYSTNSLNHPSMNGSNHTPTSSFLSSRSTASSYMGNRGKGLAELVGLPDFFFELHRRFVVLLVELSVLLNRP